MKTLNLIVGTHIRDVIENAVSLASESNETVAFTFNDKTYEVKPEMTVGDMHAEYELRTGHKILTPEAEQKKAHDDLEKMRTDQAAAIAAAKAPTEQELRNSEAPWPKSIEELTAYIKSLVDRPHDYGTCVHAMSLSAVAAFYYVCSVLGATGFQASCADLDILRRIRGYKTSFHVCDHANLLYPQYCNAEKFPHWDELIERDADLQKWIADTARKNLATSSHSHPNVVAHWKMLVSRFG
jgi:hypothetical protein